MSWCSAALEVAIQTHLAELGHAVHSNRHIKKESSYCFCVIFGLHAVVVSTHLVRQCWQNCRGLDLLELHQMGQEEQGTILQLLLGPRVGLVLRLRVRLHQGDLSLIACAQVGMNLSQPFHTAVF